MSGGGAAAGRDARIARALRWIASVLDDLGVRWVVAGGLAARAHGATRPLHDIDLYVEEGALERILPRVREHHAHGPRRHRDERWDCLFLEVGTPAKRSSWPRTPAAGTGAGRTRRGTRPASTSTRPTAARSPGWRSR